jgi:hypothetical protein
VIVWPQPLLVLDYTPRVAAGYLRK